MYILFLCTDIKVFNNLFIIQKLKYDFITENCIHVECDSDVNYLSQIF